MLWFLWSLSDPPAAQIDRRLGLARSGDKQAREDLIRQYTPLVLKVGAQVCGRYLQMGRDEEISVGLIAFNEAIDKFDLDRGAAFITFAEMVIKRRLIDHFRSQKGAAEVAFSQMEQVDDVEGPLRTIEYREAQERFFHEQEVVARQEEIARYRRRLAEFGIRFSELPAICPRHEDARRHAIDVARLVASNPLYAQHMTTKKELPLKYLETQINLSRKTLERQRKYIIAVTLILLEDFHHLKQYIIGQLRRT